MCFGGSSVPDMPKMPSPPSPLPIPTKPAEKLAKRPKLRRQKGLGDPTKKLRIPIALSAPTRKSGLSIPTYS